MDIDRSRSAPPEILDDDPELSSVMSTRLVGVAPATPVRTALQLLIAQEVHHLPVLDAGLCVGMVTEADVLRGIATEHGPLGHTTLRIRDVAQPAPMLPPGACLADAARIMLGEHTDAVLVGTPDRLLGVVTASDLVRLWVMHAARPGARRAGTGAADRAR